MPHTDLATVRVSNIPPDWQERELLRLFDRPKVRDTTRLSLCQNTAKEGTATVTFKSSSDAKNALDLNAELFRTHNISIDREFMGLTVLAAPENPSVDIIAVHGLNGHAFGTWTFHDKGTELMWLRDFLPSQAPEARIMTYGYNSALIGPKTSVSTVEDFSRDLLNRVVDDQNSTEALVLAHANPQPFHHVHEAVRSVLFFATPHGGSRSANIGFLLSRMATLAFQRPSKQLLEALKLQSPQLYQLTSIFRAIATPLNVVNFYERRITPIFNSLIVDEVSSRLGVEYEVLIPIDATHRDICKFRSPSDALYLPVLAQIRRCLDFNSRKIKLDPLLERTRALSVDDTGRNESVHYGQFIVPAMPNPNFTGREKELALMNERLEPLDDGLESRCSIFAVYGLGGVGKTQLVTKYVYEMKIKQPSTSIFWTSARSREDIELGLQYIVKKLSLIRDVNGRVHQSVPRKPGDSSLRYTDLDESLELLRDWMLASDHGRWLLVLDNYDDIDVEIRSLLPIGARGQVIVTSRDRRVVGSVAQSGLALSEMGPEDAKQLFLRTKCNYGEEELSASSLPYAEDPALIQILQELQYFPLAIVQAAAFIRENSPTTLAEYLSFLKPRTVDRERLMRFKEVNPTYPESVMTTWEISLDYLQRDHPRSSWILQLLGFLDHTEISEELLFTANEARPWTFHTKFPGRCLSTSLNLNLGYLSDDVGFRIAIGTLTSLSLVKRNASQRTLHVHPLVHEWIRVRLNNDPGLQAQLTIAAVLILCQTFPLELVTWLPDKFPIMTAELSRRIDQSSHHLRAALANVKDYHTYFGTAPLEIFTILEVFYMTGIQKHELFGLELSSEVLSELDSVVRMIIPTLSLQHQNLAFFIHKVVIWLRNDSHSRVDLRVQTEIARSLESLELGTSLENDGESVVMLLATVILDACEDVVKLPRADDLLLDQESEDGMASHKRSHHMKSFSSQRSDSRLCGLRLLNGVHILMKSLGSSSQLIRWMILIIECRIVERLVPGESVESYGLNFCYPISSEALDFLDFEQKASYLCHLTELYWTCDSPRNFDAILSIYKFTMAEVDAKLHEERRKSELKSEEELIMRFSHTEYISSSFGRSGSLEVKSNGGLDLITPLAYVWAKTLVVAESISDPDMNWRLDDKRPGESSKLNMRQREWALVLVSATKGLYDKILTNLGHGSNIELALTEYFKSSEVQATLVVILLNLEAWPQLEGALWHILRCEDIIKWRTRSGGPPWEPYKSELFSSATKPEAKEPQASRVRVQKTMSEASGSMQGNGIHDSPPEKSGVAHELTEDGFLDILESFEPWLAGLKSREMHVKSQHLLKRIKDHPRLELNWSFLEQLGVLKSSGCVTTTRVDEMILAFVAACEHREAISLQESKYRRAQLGAICSLTGWDVRYLPRLQMIYHLATSIITKGIAWNKKWPQLDSMAGPSEEDSGSSEDEFREAAEEIFQMDEEESKDFDWSW